MVWLNIIKRFAPFAATFLLGLFVASFFVTVSTPRINVRRDNYRNYEYQNKSCWNQRNKFERRQSKKIDPTMYDDDLRLRDGEINFDAIAPVAPDAPIVPRGDKR